MLESLQAGLSGFLPSIIGFIAVVGVVVFVHELGHFLAARLMGVRVDVFSIGMPPKMWSFKRGDTEYKLGWVPIGGYVKIAGMIDESMDEETITGGDDEFMSKGYFAKAFILTAGVIMNILLGIGIYSFIVLYEGKAVVNEEPVIGGIMEEYPAARAGLQENDRIINIDGELIRSWEDITQAVHPRPHDSLSVTWVRGADTLSAIMFTEAAQQPSADGVREVGLIGIGPQVEMQSVGPFTALAEGTKLTVRYLGLSLESISRLITGKASVKEFTGIVGIVHMSGETVRAGWVTFISFIGFISIAIGFFNILPVPMLDGGHLVVATIEAVIKRSISNRVKLIVQQIGLALIIILTIVVAYYDVLRIVTN